MLVTERGAIILIDMNSDCTSEVLLTTRALTWTEKFKIAEMFQGMMHTHTRGVLTCGGVLSRRASLSALLKCVR